jgi:hypothetical protein
VASKVCLRWSTRFLGQCNLEARLCRLPQSYQATVYKHFLPRSTASLLTFLEVGRYPMQVQWLLLLLPLCTSRSRSHGLSRHLWQFLCKCYHY